MPHEGQGLSNQTAHAHGASPSWVWVPCPWSEGDIHDAIPNTLMIRTEKIAAPTLAPIVARSGVVRSGLDSTCIVDWVPMHLWYTHRILD